MPVRWAQDTCTGVVICTSDRGQVLSHSGIKLKVVPLASDLLCDNNTDDTLQVSGIVQMQLSPKNVGLFEAFYASIKPIELLSYDIDVAQAVYPRLACCTFPQSRYLKNSVCVNRLTTPAAARRESCRKARQSCHLNSRFVIS